MNTPADAARTINDIERAGKRVLHEYRWLHGVALGVSVAETNGRATGVNDPTGEVATARQKAAMRRSLDKATKDLNEALGALRSAEYTLKKALAHERERIEFAQLRFPRTATRADLSDGAEAAMRRTDRGEEIPE